MLARSGSSSSSPPAPSSRRPRWASKLDVLNSLELRDRRVARAVYALHWDDFQAPWAPFARATLNTQVRMLEALNLSGSERVLDIGTGAGYRAALLGSLASNVWSIELSEAVATSARRTLERAGCANVQVLIGDGSLGWTQNAPYDAIIVGGSCPDVPNQLIHQLAEGGRLVIPIGDATGQLVVRLCRHGLAVESNTVAPCKLGPLEVRAERPSRVPWQRLPPLGSHPLPSTRRF